MQPIQQAKAVILAIDDEASVLAELTQTLTAACYTCHGCATEADALATARYAEPDLIISDVHIAGHSGVELCERLKQEAGLREVKLMFLSGAQTPDVIRRSNSAGASYYLRKPFDPQVLLELVDKALCLPHLAGHQ